MVKVIYESSAMYDLLSMGYTLVRVTAAGHAFLRRGGETAWKKQLRSKLPISTDL